MIKLSSYKFRRASQFRVANSYYRLTKNEFDDSPKLQSQVLQHILKKQSMIELIFHYKFRDKFQFELKESNLIRCDGISAARIQSNQSAKFFELG
ncbi:hypothetical protein A4A49_40042 [Nicotiana attenuata]|uniref:Uncharacterized protein n=1 Tax=Nicotiana attenuata TaxID=49451 RepID=A0A1J6IYN5_NICAT|nr:hypothetical protein A4A49_40042 [Nicotiana attenuata]